MWIGNINQSRTKITFTHNTNRWCHYHRHYYCLFGAVQFLQKMRQNHRHSWIHKPITSILTDRSPPDVVVVVPTFFRFIFTAFLWECVWHSLPVVRFTFSPCQEINVLMFLKYVWFKPYQLLLLFITFRAFVSILISHWRWFCIRAKSISFQNGFWTHDNLTNTDWALDLYKRLILYVCKVNLVYAHLLTSENAFNLKTWGWHQKATETNVISLTD